MQVDARLDGLKVLVRDSRWIPLAKAAEIAGTSTKNLRERLQRLDKRFGGGIIRKSGPSHWARFEVDLEALGLAYRSAQHLRDPDVDALKSEVAELKSRLEALRRAHLDLRRTVAS